jgi:hypothetical protein
LHLAEAFAPPRATLRLGRPLAARRGWEKFGGLMIDRARRRPAAPNKGAAGLPPGPAGRTHLEELQRNQLIKEIPKEPTGFIKLNSVLVGNDARVARPCGITTFD